MKILKRSLREGAKCPFLHGIAYYDFDSEYIVCYPFPINLLVRFFRLIFTKKNISLVEYKNKYYTKGYTVGFKEAKKVYSYLNKKNVLEILEEFERIKKEQSNGTENKD